MATPLPYIVNYSFAGFQANAPTVPLPGANLDDQLAQIAAATATLVAAINDVRRSDGKLNNGIVTFDSLEAGIRFTIDPTNGQLVAAAVATSAANAATTTSDRAATAASAANALASAIAAAASAAGINLTLYLPKAGNLANLGNNAQARANLGLGSAATYPAGAAASNVLLIQSDGKIPALDGSLLTSIDTVPVGTTIWTNGTAAPTGFLKENGALVSRVTYARLYAFAIASGNIQPEATWAAGGNGGFSSGDLSTTFRLPDSRGEFVRGWDDGRGVDTGRAINTNQADALKDHTHTVVAAKQNTNQAVNSAGSVLGATDGTQTTGSPSTGAAAETRPRNITKLACIKY